MSVAGKAARAAAQKAPTPHVVAASVDNASWVPLVKVSGDSGMLTGLGVAGGPDYHRFKVEIDGVLVVDQFLAGTGMATHVNNGIGVGLPFAGDLIVHGRDDPAPSAVAKYWVAFVTDHSEPIEETIQVESIEGKEYLYRRQAYRKPDGDSYSVESLLGPHRTARVRLARDWFKLESYSLGEGGQAQIAAEVVLSEAEAGEHDAIRPYAVVRVAGRQTVVDEVILAGLEEARPITIPAPGEYSIATTLDNFSNVPAHLTVR